MFYKTPVDKLRQEARNAAQSPLPLPFMLEALEDVWEYRLVFRESYAWSLQGPSSLSWIGCARDQ
ncbi:hypothetical protein N7465_000395 [Penicillium sp. CMV-2018d]|nr:hypothetical protein N7465_000395 [Penicillium sp. CMV-2018d]